MSEMSSEDQHIHEIAHKHTEPLREIITRLQTDLLTLEDNLAGVENDVDIKLRDRFAMAALNGMISSDPIADRTMVDKNHWARIAFAFADAMIKARS